MSRAGYIRRTAPFNNVLVGDSVRFAEAFHEAGHAVLAARFEIGIERVAIKRLPGKLACSTCLFGQ